MVNETIAFREIANLGYSLQQLRLQRQSITQDELIHIIERCPHLFRLFVEWCCDVTNAVLSAMTSSLSRLRELRIAHYNVDRGALARLLEHKGARLEKLDIGAEQSNEVTICAIAEHCTNLQDLVLHGNSAEPSTALVMLFQKLRSLRTIGLQCVKLSKDILLSIADNCVARLTTLDLYSNATIFRAEMGELADAMRLLVTRAPVLSRLFVSHSSSLFTAEFRRELAELKPQLRVANDWLP